MGTPSLRFILDKPRDSTAPQLLISFMPSAEKAQQKQSENRWAIMRALMGEVEPREFHLINAERSDGNFTAIARSDLCAEILTIGNVEVMFEPLVPPAVENGAAARPAPRRGSWSRVRHDDFTPRDLYEICQLCGIDGLTQGMCDHMLKVVEFQHPLDPKYFKITAPSLHIVQESLFFFGEDRHECKRPLPPIAGDP